SPCLASKANGQNWSLPTWPSFLRLTKHTPPPWGEQLSAYYNGPASSPRRSTSRTLCFAGILEMLTRTFFTSSCACNWTRRVGPRTPQKQSHQGPRSAIEKSARTRSVGSSLRKTDRKKQEASFLRTTPASNGCWICAWVSNSSFQ